MTGPIQAVGNGRKIDANRIFARRTQVQLAPAEPAMVV